MKRWNTIVIGDGFAEFVRSWGIGRLKYRVPVRENLLVIRWGWRESGNYGSANS